MATGIIKTRDGTIEARDAKIAGLRSELDNIRSARVPCPDIIAAELQKEEALDKELAQEKRKEAELEQSLKRSKEDLEKDERDLTEDNKVRVG